MTTKDNTGLEIDEHGTTLIVRINGGKHALFSQDIAAQLGKLVDRADKDPNIRAVVFTGAHPDRFLSHADVAWLQRAASDSRPSIRASLGLCRAWRKPLIKCRLSDHWQA